MNHVYGYSDQDWTFHPAPDSAKAATLGIDPGVRKTDAVETGVADDPWAASAGDDAPSNHEAQISRLIDDLLAGRTHDTTLASTRPTMEFVTALYASAITGQAVRRTDLTPDHPFYQALHGNTPKTELSDSFRP